MPGGALSAENEESCIRKAITERGLIGGRVGLSDTISLNEAGSRWADCGLPMEIEWLDVRASRFDVTVLRSDGSVLEPRS